MSPDRIALLEALGTVLRVAGFHAVMSPRGLEVENPNTSGCCGGHPSTVVIVAPREDDGGRLWFVTTWRYPLAEASRIPDALTALTGLLNGVPGVAL